MKNLNKRLLRQVKRKYGSVENIPDDFKDLLTVISNSYDHYERDRNLLERAMDLSSEEIRNYYEKLATQNELKRINSELEQFAYIASHDLQEPLRTIYSFTQLLGKHVGNEPKPQKYMQYILSGVKRMHELLNNLLRYSTLGNGPSKDAPTDLNEVLDFVFKNLNSLIRETQASIRADHLPEIIANPSSMVQLFQNLISNALKYNHSGNPVVSIYAKTEGQYHIISVEDNGVGIPPGSESRIFDLFYQLSSEYSQKGSGIGLSICKKIVEEMGGKIWFKSRAEGGTVFSFSVPVYLSDQVDQYVGNDESISLA